MRKRDYPVWWFLQGVARLPFRALYAIADLVYFLLFYVVKYRRKVVFRNLQNSFPDKSQAELRLIAKQFYRNLADIIFEILKLGQISKAELCRRIHYQNPELLQAYLDKGLTIFTLGSHAGNWEWGLASSPCFLDFPADGVYKPLQNSFFEKYMHFLRSRLGPNPLPMKEVLRHLIRHRSEPRLVALLSDQTPPRGEIQYWTNFLNQETGFYVGADKLAATFKYPVVFIKVVRQKRGHYVFSFELLAEPGEITVAEAYRVTEAYARKLENLINQYPSDYLWSHRRWKHKKPVNTLPN